MGVTVKIENLRVEKPHSREPKKTALLLDGIYAHVKPGQLMAVMGPSGCGKTTFLSALSGRIKSTGDLLFNGLPLTKATRRQVCYILQNDVFLSELTLRQTLEVAAQLRLPDSLTRADKRAKVEHVLEALDLKSCEHTLVGHFMRPGLSGGQKKRCSIGCELISDPKIMLIDEPTSSLDSCTAFSLLKLLKGYALREQKTIILTIHQPSSQMFYMFDKLLLLSHGQMLYYGDSRQAVSFFARHHHHMQQVNYNPADFLLDVSKQLDDRQRNELAASSRHAFELIHASEKPISACLSTSSSHIACSSADSIASSDNERPAESSKATRDEQFSRPRADSSNQVIEMPKTNPDANPLSAWSSLTFSYKVHEDDGSSSNNEQLDVYDQPDQRWPTGLMTQFRTLTWRNFIVNKRRIYDKPKILQTIGIALIVGLIWFQVPRDETTIQDFKGWIFFANMYTSMFALYTCLTNTMLESQILNKERLAGTYRLSAYYLAKSVTELPLIIVHSTIFHLISYIMVGVRNFFTCFSLYGSTLLTAVAAQSMGLCFGYFFTDMDNSITFCSVYSTLLMLFTGFYTKRIPEWLYNAQYFSFLNYGYHNMMIAEFSYDQSFACISSQNSTFSSCQSPVNNSSNSAQRFINTSEILIGLDSSRPNAPPLPIWLNCVFLILFSIVFRVLAYFLLRFLHKPAYN